MVADLPDWQQSYGNAGITLSSGVVPAGNQLSLNPVGNTVITISATGQANGKFVIPVTWFTDDGFGTLLETQYFTCDADPTAVGVMTFQVPVKGGGMRVGNQSAIAVNITVVAAVGSLSESRLLNATGPGRIFQFAGAMVLNTPIRLPAIDGSGGLYASNATSGLYASASVAGSFQCEYVDISGTVRDLPILTVAVSVFTPITLILPQGMVGFVFVPAATNAAASANVFAFPGQL